MESIIFKLAISKISIFLLVSVAEETGLSLALKEIPKTSHQFQSKGDNTKKDSSCLGQIPSLSSFITYPYGFGEKQTKGEISKIESA